MIGIRRWGSYIPILRIDRSTIAQAWERPSMGGERSVANNDEDGITMAVEAARNCLNGQARDAIQALYFGTTTAPYSEKANSAIIAAAVDSKNEIHALDFSNSLRAGTGALKAGFDAIGGGGMQNVLVVAADCRKGYPRSNEEQSFGDGAAAFLLGRDEVVARLEGTYSLCSEMMDVWRKDDDKFIRQWENRFIMAEGYAKHMKQVVFGIMKKYDLKSKDIAKAIFPAPNLRSHHALFKQLGFDTKSQAQDPLLNNVGFCGTAQALMMLSGALEEAAPGDLLLLAAYGDGADAMLFKVTDKIQEEQPKRQLKQYLEEKIMLPSYTRFLSYKGLVETVPGEPFRLLPSATVTWRDRASIIRCHGSRCRKCGATAFPVQRICCGCSAKDDFEEVALADMEGQVFTFTLDNLAGRSDDPVVVQTVAEFGNEKVRFYGMMTDCEPSEVRVGIPVGLTFRRIYDGAGMHNYFWKCRPLRNGRNS